MGALFLVLTIIAESAAVIFMKLSNGFQHKGYAVAAVATYLLSFVFLTFALKSLPVGLANAIWAGASTVVVGSVGNLYLQRTIKPFANHLSFDDCCGVGRVEYYKACLIPYLPENCLEGNFHQDYPDIIQQWVLNVAGK